jgi:hypothetical protein
MLNEGEYETFITAIYILRINFNVLSILGSLFIILTIFFGNALLYIT